MKESNFIEKLRVRVTAAQKEHITTKCMKYGVKSGAYIRRLIDKDMGEPVNEETQEEYLLKKDLLYEMNRIGNNINQIVKNLNSNFYSEYEKKKLFALMKNLEKLMSEKL